MTPKKYLFYFLAILLGVALNSCSDSDDDDVDETMFEITIDSPLITNGEDFTCDNTGGTFVIDLKSSVSRDVSSEIEVVNDQEADWITAEVKDMQLMLNIAEYNDKYSKRYARIMLVGDNLMNYVTLYIVQTPVHVSAAYYNKLIYTGSGTFTEDGWHLNSWGDDRVFVRVMIFDDSLPVDIEITSDCSWLSWGTPKDLGDSFASSIAGRSYRLSECSISVNLNDTGAQRTGHFTMKTSAGEEIGTFTIVQDYQTMHFYNTYVE